MDIVKNTPKVSDEIGIVLLSIHIIYFRSSAPVIFPISFLTLANITPTGWGWSEGGDIVARIKRFNQICQQIYFMIFHRESSSLSLDEII